jgi:outer membrane protein OmpA-like peptidoglycan-associated protein
MSLPTLVMTTALVLALAIPGSAAQTGKVDSRLSVTASMNLVDRTIKTINYQHRNGSTKIELYGTILLPAFHGEARVENRRTYSEIEVVFRNLQSATHFGPEFITYVLWAVSPEGRPTNLGEVIIRGTGSRLEVTTELQAFGLIVTAEPYFGVTQPSDVVVMENVVGKETDVKAGEIDAKYALLPRGHYTANALTAELVPIAAQKDTPLNLYEARNAVRIARWAGADVHASDRFQRASSLLAQAEDFKASNFESQSIDANAREAVLTAEDARLITLKVQSEARLAKEREDFDIRAAAANAAAAKLLTDASDAFRLNAVASNAAAAKALTDASDAFHLSANAAAQHAAQNNQTLKSGDVLEIKVVTGESERGKQELRSKLMTQLKEVLQTEDGARGLIVNIAGSFFGTGQYWLNSAAKEKLTRISVIVLAHPTLKIEVGGYTDNEGTEQSNVVLSENRADAVRDFLLSRGIAASSISSIGHGEGRPVATNDTAAGRQQNRRVELVISGDIIGGGSANRAQLNK